MSAGSESTALPRATNVSRVRTATVTLILAYSLAVATAIFSIHKLIVLWSCITLFTILALPFLLFASLKSLGVHPVFRLIHAILIFVVAWGGGQLFNHALRSRAIRAFEQNERHFRVLMYNFDTRRDDESDPSSTRVYYNAPNCWYTVNVRRDKLGIRAWLTD